MIVKESDSLRGKFPCGLSTSTPTKNQFALCRVFKIHVTHVSQREIRVYYINISDESTFQTLRITSCQLRNEREKNSTALLHTNRSPKDQLRMCNSQS
jgi:hypothetical protein